MGVRENLNEHPYFALGAAVVAIAVVVVATVSRFGGASEQAAPHTPGKAWFSDDDGKTWFADDEHRIPPFDHNGKPAYRAYVFTCDGGTTKFVAYLARFSPQGKARLQAAAARGEPPDMRLSGLSPASGLELKKPGATQWIMASDPHVAQVQQPVCPQGGGTGEPEPVYP